LSPIVTHESTTETCLQPGAEDLALSSRRRVILVSDDDGAALFCRNA